MRKLLIAGLTALSLFAAPLATHAFDSANDPYGVYTSGSNANYHTDANASNLAYFIGYYIIKPLLGMVGVIFLVLFIYGGLMWMTAGGSPDQIKKAKQILINATIGVVIVATAYALTNFIFGALAGTSSSSSSSSSSTTA